ncbi:MAG: O-antigen ligase family protein [Candidatus Uhrbacteria bacterium]|nr:O-antigen ligase family protein [Candidatus Uhrbacteria bacterium]MDP3794187.1 O-antigen ligase family protein [Candidatus Uhrbacteria bacterium]
MKTALYWFLGIAGVEVLSRLVIFHPSINGFIALTIGAIVLALAIKRPSIALAVLSIEYLIGSHGSLFKFLGDAQNHGSFSIREILFAAFIIGWFIWSLRHKTWKGWGEIMRTRKIYFVLAAVVVYGVVLGFVRGNRQFLFADANAWGAWLLLLPILDIISFEKQRWLSIITPAITAALIWLPIKTLGLLYIFTHHFTTIQEPLYLWVRRTGIGEITAIGGGAYRIFFQSHIYGVFGVIALLMWSAFRSTQSTEHTSPQPSLFESEPQSRGPSQGEGVFRFLLFVSVAEILASLSRSFWLGLGIGWLIGLLFLLRRKRDRVWQFIRTTLIAGILGMGLVFSITLFPWPTVSSSDPFGMWENRVNLGESAVLSRWQLLPILWEKIKQHPITGSGFGATVTYKSLDPRIVKTGGMATTYAFEWGWLEHWVKFGLIGIPIMLALLISLIRRTWRSSQPDWIKWTLVSSMIALAATHFFSPYLNHPLGIFALIMAESTLLLFDKNKL